jgi:hypothetical protein
MMKWCSPASQHRPVRDHERRRRLGRRPARRIEPVAAHAAASKVYPGGDEPVDMGFVGDVVGFNLELLATL